MQPSGRVDVTVNSLGYNSSYQLLVTAGFNQEVVTPTSDSSGNIVLTTTKSFLNSDPTITVLGSVSGSVECTGKLSTLSTPESSVITVCDVAGDKTAECTSCTTSGGIWTALGCIPFTQDKFIFALVKIIMGVAGFISLAMMLTGTIMLMTGGANQEQMKKGKEIFTGAVVGLLFFIFSAVILQIITRDIIQLDISTPAGPVNYTGPGR